MKTKSTLPFIIAVPLLGILLVAGVAIAMRMGEKEGVKLSEKEGYVKEESVTKGSGSFGQAKDEIVGKTGTAEVDALSKELQDITESDDGLTQLDADIQKL